MGSARYPQMLMVHSGDVELMHCNAQSPEDLKGIYDKVMNNRNNN